MELLNNLEFLVFLDEEKLERSCEPPHLNFSIEPALVTADAVHYARYVVELILDLSQ